jgi:hypothetical protein
METRADQLSRVQHLEVRGAWNATRVADLDHRLGTGKRQPEIDFQRRRALGHVALGQSPGLLGVPGDNRVGRVGRAVAIDMRTRREDARSGQLVGRDQPAQFDKLFVPLSRIAERSDAMTQLPQRQLRLVLDVEMQIDESRDYGESRQIDRLGVFRYCRRRRRPDPIDPVAIDDDPGALDGGRAGAVDQAHVVEHHRATLCAEGRAERRDGEEGDNAGPSDHRYPGSRLRAGECTGETDM